MHFTGKNRDSHYLLVRAGLSRTENYPLRPNKIIKSKVIGKAVVFFNEDDEDDLLKQLNDKNSAPTFNKLIKDEIEDYGDPSNW